jgi:hypothetical protein
MHMADVPSINTEADFVNYLIALIDKAK